MKEKYFLLLFSVDFKEKQNLFKNINKQIYFKKLKIFDTIFYLVVIKSIVKNKYADVSVYLKLKYTSRFN